MGEISALAFFLPLGFASLSPLVFSSYPFTSRPPSPLSTVDWCHRSYLSPVTGLCLRSARIYVPEVGARFAAPSLPPSPLPLPLPLCVVLVPLLIGPNRVPIFGRGQIGAWRRDGPPGCVAAGSPSAVLGATVNQQADSPRPSTNGSFAGYPLPNSKT